MFGGSVNELKTPLTAIRVAVENLRDNLTPTVREEQAGAEETGTRGRERLGHPKGQSTARSG